MNTPRRFLAALENAAGAPKHCTTYTIEVRMF